MFRSCMKTSVQILPVLLLAVLATTACSNGKAASAAAPHAMPVKVRTAAAQKVDETTEYVATLKSRDSAVVSPQVEGIITKIFVRSGDRVADGAPMMQIDPEKQQATLKSQESATAAQLAQLKLAQQNYDRTSGLAAAGVVSKQDLDQARSRLLMPRKRNCNRSAHRSTSRGPVALLQGCRSPRRSRRRCSRSGRRPRADHHRSSPRSIAPAAWKRIFIFRSKNRATVQDESSRTDR